MQDDGSAATAMLGLAGFVLLAVSEQDGELEQAVETTARRGLAAAAAGCGRGCTTGGRPGCGICRRRAGR